MTEIAGILLAAGAARRFGTPKLLHPLPDGVPVGIASARQLGISMDVVNVNGGAIAMGHPLGATGAKIAERVPSTRRAVPRAARCQAYSR